MSCRWRDGADPRRGRRRRNRRHSARPFAQSDDHRHGLDRRSTTRFARSASSILWTIANANVAREVRRMTGNRGVDVVLDPVGGQSFSDQLSAAGATRPAGHVRCVVDLTRRTSQLAARGARDHADATIQAAVAHQPQSRDFRTQPRCISGTSAASSHRPCSFFSKRSAAQRLLPVIAKTFPLERAGDAHRYMQGRGNIGKIVLTV